MLRRGVGSVTCIACGACVDSADAHEYDKNGDLSTVCGDRIEYLCTSCFDDLSTADRSGLEQLLCHLEAGSVSTHEFLRRYADAVRESDQ